jgi:hypothetical protein
MGNVGQQVVCLAVRGSGTSPPRGELRLGLPDGYDGGARAWSSVCTEGVCEQPDYGDLEDE